MVHHEARSLQTRHRKQPQTQSQQSGNHTQSQDCGCSRKQLSGAVRTWNLALQVAGVLLILALHLQQYGSKDWATKAACLLSLCYPVISLPHAITTSQDP